MQGSDLTAKVRAELEQIMPLLSIYTGLPTRWSGVVELVPEADFKGKKRFTCDIQIDAALADQEVRWRTLIPECLHAHSAGYVRPDFLRFPGWEEGVVERLQRIFRPAILASLNVSVSEEVFSPPEASHAYNAYIEALENIRTMLAIPEVQFYQDLLATPIGTRPASILNLMRRLPVARQHEAIAIFSSANAILKARL